MLNFSLPKIPPAALQVNIKVVHYLCLNCQGPGKYSQLPSQKVA